MTYIELARRALAFCLDLFRQHIRDRRERQSEAERRAHAILMLVLLLLLALLLTLGCALRWEVGRGRVTFLGFELAGEDVSGAATTGSETGDSGVCDVGAEGEEVGELSGTDTEGGKIDSHENPRTGD